MTHSDNLYQNETNESKRTFLNPNVEGQSRTLILQELTAMGLDPHYFDPLSINDLRNVLSNLCSLMEQNHAKAGRPRNDSYSEPKLSNYDKKILYSLLASGGYVSTKTLSKQLGIPPSTVQRRRNNLERDVIDKHYTLKFSKLGLRIATLFISSGGKNPSLIGKEILEMTDMVTSVVRTLGESTIDLKVELVFRSNQDLVSLIDRIRAMEGVRSLLWSESVEIVGKKSKYYQMI